MIRVSNLKSVQQKYLQTARTTQRIPLDTAEKAKWKSGQLDGPKFFPSTQLVVSYLDKH